MKDILKKGIDKILNSHLGEFNSKSPKSRLDKEYNKLDRGNIGHTESNFIADTVIKHPDSTNKMISHAIVTLHNNRYDNIKNSLLDAVNHPNLRHDTINTLAIIGDDSIRKNLLDKHPLDKNNVINIIKNTNNSDIIHYTVTKYFNHYPSDVTNQAVKNPFTNTNTLDYLNEKSSKLSPILAIHDNASDKILNTSLEHSNKFDVLHYATHLNISNNTLNNMQSHEYFKSGESHVNNTYNITEDYNDKGKINTTLFTLDNIKDRYNQHIKEINAAKEIINFRVKNNLFINTNDK